MEAPFREEDFDVNQVPIVAKTPRTTFLEYLSSQDLHH
jgi:hypothetical protein